MMLNMPINATYGSISSRLVKVLLTDCLWQGYDRAVADRRSRSLRGRMHTHKRAGFLPMSARNARVWKK